MPYKCGTKPALFQNDEQQKFFDQCHLLRNEKHYASKNKYSPWLAAIYATETIFPGTTQIRDGELPVRHVEQMAIDSELVPLHIEQMIFHIELIPLHIEQMIFHIELILLHIEQMVIHLALVLLRIEQVIFHLE